MHCFTTFGISFNEVTISSPKSVSIKPTFASWKVTRDLLHRFDLLLDLSKVVVLDEEIF